MSLLLFCITFGAQRAAAPAIISNGETITLAAEEVVLQIGSVRIRIMQCTR